MFSQGYIGVTNNVDKRWNRHEKRTQNAHLKNAINKYGWNNLVKKVLLVAEESYCLMIEAKIRATENIGWNIAKGGGKPPSMVNSGSFVKGSVPINKGVPMSEETKKKVSESKKGKKLPDAHYEKLAVMFKGEGNPNYGKPMSDEQKAKISASKKGCVSPRKGVVLSADVRAKMSDAKKGKVFFTEETRKKISLANTGRKYEMVKCPHCGKIGGLTGMPKWHFNNCRFKEKQ